MISLWLLVYCCREGGWKSLKLPKEVYKLGYNVDMKKSGKTNRYEPTDTSWENDFP